MNVYIRKLTFAFHYMEIIISFSHISLKKTAKYLNFFFIFSRYIILQKFGRSNNRLDFLVFSLIFIFGIIKTCASM